MTHRLDDLEGLGVQLGIVVAFGALIPASVLERTPMLNVHFSLLPRWRGAAPVERAILAGDVETGVSVMSLEVDLDTAPHGLFDAVVRREGTDVTVIGYGSSVKTILRAADTAATEGRSIEVIDVRSIAPLDLAPMIKSLEKTGRLVVVQEAPNTASVASEIVAELSERCFYSLRAPGIRVGGYHVPYPPSRIEDEYRPSVDRILDGVDRVMGFES